MHSNRAYERFHRDPNYFYLDERSHITLDKQREMLETKTCGIITQNMLKAHAPRMVENFGRQPFRIGKVPFSHNYISWAVPKRRSWVRALDRLMRHLAEAGIPNLMVLREIPPR